MYEPAPRVIDAVQKLKGVFLEAPSTQMSLVDASRLSGLERNTTRLILEALEDARHGSIRGEEQQRDNEQRVQRYGDEGGKAGDHPGGVGHAADIGFRSRITRPRW